MQLCHVNGVQSIGSHAFEFKLQCMFFFFHTMFGAQEMLVLFFLYH